MPSRFLFLDLPMYASYEECEQFSSAGTTLSAVEPPLWRVRIGHCNKCSSASVQNEVHLLFLCHFEDLVVCSP